MEPALSRSSPIGLQASLPATEVNQTLLHLDARRPSQKPQRPDVGAMSVFAPLPGSTWWPETHEKASRPRTASSYILAKEEERGERGKALHHSLSTHTSSNPEIEEIALLLRFWVPLLVRPAVEQKQTVTQDSLPVRPPVETTVCSPSPEEHLPPSQRHFSCRLECLLEAEMGRIAEQLLAKKGAFHNDISIYQSSSHEGSGHGGVFHLS